EHPETLGERLLGIVREMLNAFQVQRAKVREAELLEEVCTGPRLTRRRRRVGNDCETVAADHRARPASRLVMDGARHRFVVAARWTADEERLVGRRRFLDVAAEACGGGTVAGEHPLAPVARLAQQFLRNE